jgi:hypothetical protein
MIRALGSICNENNILFDSKKIGWKFCWKFSSKRSILAKKPAGREKNLQFHMQFATKAQGFGGWTF